MELDYRKATTDDLDILTKTRIEVLRAVNGLDDNTNMSRVEKEALAYECFSK